MDPDKTNPGLTHAMRIAHLARTMEIRARHMAAMRREGWRYRPTGAGQGFVLEPPRDVDDFEITVEG